MKGIPHYASPSQAQIWLHSEWQVTLVRKWGGKKRRFQKACKII